MSPEGGIIDYAASGCEQVEEVVVLTGIKPPGGKNIQQQLWWTSTKGKNGDFYSPASIWTDVRSTV